MPTKQLSVNNLTRTPVRVSLLKKAHARVAPALDVSVVLIGSATAKRLNKSLRKKTYTPNVLTLPLSKKSGEVYLCPQQIKKDMKTFALAFDDCVLFMFIHALLHLKGLPHGATMEREEWRYLRALTKPRTINEATHRRRNRSRNTSY